MFTVQLGMIETEMVEVLYVILETICVLKSIIIPLTMFFFEMFILKIKPITIDLQIQNDF